jgi:protoporphyrinogen oxidase
MPPIDQSRIVILGAGPTGLGAAHRLQEVGLSNATVFEREDRAGGLASSFTDHAGFTWDVGGHVQFSHYGHFDRLMDSLLPNEWLTHERESWIWIAERFVPYPFQNNIRYLPDNALKDCLRGLIKVYRSNGSAPQNFEEWIAKSFGEGIAKHFMMPYNFKVWAYPPSHLSYRWIGERVAQVDLERVVFNVLEQRDDVSWGPNSTFRFPTRGGTGEIWRRYAARLRTGSIVLNKPMRYIESAKRRVHFEDGSAEPYDLLISTVPLDFLVAHSDMDDLKEAAKRLSYSTSHIVGIGLKGAPPPHVQTKCWMYFPEETSPFYRATVFSNYSPNNVPDIRQYWSLMTEVSESRCKPVDRDRLEDSVVRGLLATRLIDSAADIVDLWRYTADHGYPTPSLQRDQALEALLPALESRGIFSRGRFGAWKYEVSNQDHSLMQGVELIDRLVQGTEELTIWRPDFVNGTKRP